jgi:hypothetical protein
METATLVPIFSSDSVNIPPEYEILSPAKIIIEQLIF